ncbi:NADH-quinone oxidoreductase subunit NuoG [Candidatus Viadribacter manganicus]|uniref:NADH-quinone oxidoreductase n=1 Tax=Candidatus Viadribacter manganicus TaxID=1759059 RepID=A0A1B1ADD9_9PROT|nr:NADH-quinone oxidoreductase subunit NuoG [Candidatus Viadribacter manganicus]ANP44577.1 NADH dehydrogenase [Candidatus Viadribacter manganicus]
MTKILVDGVEVDVPPELTLLQACEAAGAEIPRFCYHERLSIAGNCRMCLIEVKVGGKSGPKPVASCAQQVKDLPPPRDEMLNELVTKSATVERARKGVMEFLLINHPLDCPICDQGGECDLQDQSVAYGRGGSRFDENKRAVEEKFMGPLVKTVMTRCIQCTRCVRFATEVAGVPELGATGRGEDMEITTYLEASLSSELSANVIDLCPVGALTSKPYAFNARPWELTKTETIDVMDALGSNIRVDVRGDAVLRVLPRVNEEINEEWISDKTRYAEDGLSRQRLDRPYIRENGKLRPATWQEALETAAYALKRDGSKIGAIAGDLACAESMKATLDLLRSLGSPNTDCRADGAQIGGGARQEYLFNSTIAGIDEADAILLVGANPRIEAPVLNARLRKAWLRGAEIGVVGEAADLTYKYVHIGAGPQSLSNLGAFGDKLKNAQRPMVVVGAAALARADGAAVLRAAGKIAAGVSKDGWNAFNLLHTAASRVAGLDLGFLPAQGGMSATEMLKGGLDTLILLGVDEVALPSAGTIIYIGTHGDAGAHRADIILPAAAYTEKDATWVNTEGRVQYGRRATFPKGEAKEDWTILRALSAILGKALPYDTLSALRQRMISDHPSFGHVDYAPGSADAGAFNAATIGADGQVSSEAFRSAIGDFYLTNPIARASKTMAECSRLRANSSKVAAE